MILSSFVVEVSFGLFSNSLALVTDGMHALLDALVSVVLILAVRMAVKPPDAEHTYGHGKIESLGGLLGGIAILFIAGFFVYESIDRLQGPPPDLLPGSVALIAGVYTIGADIFRILYLRRSIKKIGGISLKADFYHAFLDFGSTMVAIAGILLVTYGIYHADFAAALVLGIVLAALSIKLIHRTSLDLIDTIPPEIVDRARQSAGNTDGVLEVGSILMRRSGDTIFGDVTVSMRADVSFDQAHEISSAVERNIESEIKNSSITVHFEPNWSGVSDDVQINDIASSVNGVKNVHNASLHRSGSSMYASLHVMVDGSIDLESAHKISDEIEKRIHAQMPHIDHVTIHLEPHVTMPGTLSTGDRRREIEEILRKYAEIKKVSRIATFYFKDIKKVEIDCSFDRTLSIQRVHDLTSEVENAIRKKMGNAVIIIHPEPV